MVPQETSGQEQRAVQVKIGIMCDPWFPHFQKLSMCIVQNGGDLLVHYSPYELVPNLGKVEELLTPSLRYCLAGCQEKKARPPLLVFGQKLL